MRKIERLCILMAILTLGLASSCCAQTQDETISTGQVHVIRDDVYGALYLEPTIEEFNAMGFQFGDSVDLELDNGFRLEDIPYYSGYYCSSGQPLLCGYQGYPHVAAAYQYGDFMWDVSKANENTLAVVTLREPGKYLVVQEIYSMSYDDAQDPDESDEEFANFRALAGGNLKENFLYRSASPCDNTYNRADVADDLAEEYGIRYVINLADSQEELDEYRGMEDYNSDYYDRLCEEENVLLLNLGVNYQDQSFAEAVANALYKMSGHDGPCLIHCLEGKDRTGFVCALILSLCDADHQEIIDDYAITYKNYYGIDKAQDPERYEAITVFAYEYLEYLTGIKNNADMTPEVLDDGAKRYLRYGGLTDEQIAELEEALCK